MSRFGEFEFVSCLDFNKLVSHKCLLKHIHTLLTAKTVMSMNTKQIHTCYIHTPSTCMQLVYNTPIACA